MENYFYWLSDEPEVTVWVEPLTSNYDDMIMSIIQWVPDPRLQNEQSD